MIYNRTKFLTDYIVNNKLKSRT
jgi:glutaminyl-tRNA synthetase